MSDIYTRLEWGSDVLETKELRKPLESLCIEDESWMRQVLEGEYDSLRTKDIGFILATERDTGEVVGWVTGLCTLIKRKCYRLDYAYTTFPERYTEVSVYVSENYRGQGLATRLLQEIKSVFPPPYISFPLDEKGTHLFQKNGIEVFNEQTMEETTGMS